MKGSSRIFLSDLMRGAACGGACGGGLFFPIDLFAQIDSLRMSLRPIEIMANASFAWVLYCGFSALAGAVAVGVISGLLLLFRRYDNRAIRLSINIIFAIFTAQLLVREAVRLAPFGSDLFRWALTRIFTIAFAAWLVIWHTAILQRVRGFLYAVTTAGACVATVTILFASVGSKRVPEGRPSANPSRPSVILITIDTLAANRMSLYGYFRDTTPSLKQFASEAFVFDRHYANANYTTPSIGSILTGTLPWEHRIFQLNSRPLPSIAERGLIPALRRSGYRTLAIATNPYASPELHRVDQWIDRELLGKADRLEYSFLHAFPTFGSVLLFPTVGWIRPMCNRFMYRNYTSNLHYDPEAALSGARALLAAEPRNQDPVFLWVHLFPPHDPYAPPAPFLRSFDPSDKALTVNDSAAPGYWLASQYPGFPGALSGRYDEAVRYVDDHVGHFLHWLKAEGYYANSLIIVTSDHGESFAHSYGMHGGPMLYEDLIHVPLLVKVPGQYTGARVRDLVTEHADLLPTVLDYVNLPAPVGLAGRSLRPAMEGRTLSPRPVFVMNFQQNSCFGPIQNGTVATVNGRYKYVRFLGRVSYGYMPELHDGLYDIISDPAENTDLTAAQPDIAARMRESIDAAVAEHSLPKTHM